VQEPWLVNEREVLKETISSHLIHRVVHVRHGKNIVADKYDIIGEMFVRIALLQRLEVVHINVHVVRQWSTPTSNV